MAKAMITPELLERAIAREPRAVREFVAILTPIFWWRIGRVLLADRGASRQDTADLCQDTFVALLQDDGRLVRAWDPARGSSFENFSGRIAEQRALRYLTRTREEFHDAASCDDLEPVVDSSRTPDRIAASRDLLRKVFDILRKDLSDLGRNMFELLFVEERTVAEVCILMKMEADAVYAWRSRLARCIQQIINTMGGAE